MQCSFLSPYNEQDRLKAPKSIPIKVTFDNYYALTLADAPHFPQIGDMLIETEKTPNPATLKFLPGQNIMTNGTRDFANPEDAEISPLASALFDLGDVALPHANNNEKCIKGEFEDNYRKRRVFSTVKQTENYIICILI